MCKSERKMKNEQSHPIQDDSSSRGEEIKSLSSGKKNMQKKSVKSLGNTEEQIKLQSTSTYNVNKSENV